MGTLRERGTPFFATPSTFAATFPTVERAVVRFTETDFGNDPHDRVHDLAHGPRTACSNPRCYRGGYDFESQVRRMVEQVLESETVDMSCNGDEGTPEGRKKGQSCLMSIKGTITITYRKPPELSVTPKVL